MSKTLYAQLANNLTEGITSGRYPVGTLLPTEQKLSEQFQTSRSTVRAAISQLKEQGMVSSRKKVGTRVENSKSSGEYRQKLATIDDLLQFGFDNVRLVDKVVDFIADCPFSEEMGCLPGTNWLRISAVRSKSLPEKQPAGWSEVYIVPEYSELVEIACKTPKTLFSELIESRYGRSIAEIKQEIQAVLISPEQAIQLNTRVGSPAFKTLRKYYDRNGELFEMSVTILPADRFTFSMKLTRELK